MLAYDETTITKSGKKTYGIDQYYSGTHGHVVKGLSFGVLALVDITDRIGMTWKGGVTPHPLQTLCTIRSRKITTAVTVVPKHTGDITLLPPKLHNALKSQIECTISARWRINAPPNNQRTA